MVDFQGMANGNPTAEDTGHIHINELTNTALVSATIKALRKLIAELPMGATPVLVMNLRMAAAIVNGLQESQRPRADLVAVARAIRRRYWPYLGVQTCMTLVFWISVHDAPFTMFLGTVIAGQAYGVWHATKMFELMAKRFLPSKGGK